MTDELRVIGPHRVRYHVLEQVTDIGAGRHWAWGNMRIFEALREMRPGGSGFARRVREMMRQPIRHQLLDVAFAARRVA